MSFYLCDYFNTNYNQTYDNVNNTTYPATSPADIAYRFPTMYSGSFVYENTYSKNQTLTLPISCKNLNVTSTLKSLYIQSLTFSSYGISPTGLKFFNTFFYYFTDYISVNGNYQTYPIVNTKLTYYGNPYYYQLFESSDPLYPSIVVSPIDFGGDGSVKISIQTPGDSEGINGTNYYWSITINI